MGVLSQFLGVTGIIVSEISLYSIYSISDQPISLYSINSIIVCPYGHWRWYSPLLKQLGSPTAAWPRDRCGIIPDPRRRLLGHGEGGKLREREVNSVGEVGFRAGTSAKCKSSLGGVL